MKDLFDYSKMDKIKLNGWKTDSFLKTYSKSFKVENSIFKAIVPSSCAKGFTTNGVGSRYFGQGFEIRMFQSGYYSDTYLSRLLFSIKGSGAKTILNYIQGKTQIRKALFGNKPSRDRRQQ